jgi:hypothetical protein
MNTTMLLQSMKIIVVSINQKALRIMISCFSTEISFLLFQCFNVFTLFIRSYASVLKLLEVQILFDVISLKNYWSSMDVRAFILI